MPDIKKEDDRIKKLIIGSFELEDGAINALRQLEKAELQIENTSLVKEAKETRSAIRGQVTDGLYNRKDTVRMPGGSEDQMMTSVKENSVTLPLTGPTTIGTFPYNSGGQIMITGPLFKDDSSDEDKDFNKYLLRRGVSSSDVDHFEQAILKGHTMVLAETSDSLSGLVASKLRSQGALDVGVYQH